VTKDVLAKFFYYFIELYFHPNLSVLHSKAGIAVPAIFIAYIRE